jgi:hypothetical protein
MLERQGMEFVLMENSLLTRTNQQEAEESTEEVSYFF